MNHLPIPSSAEPASPEGQLLAPDPLASQIFEHEKLRPTAGAGDLLAGLRESLADGSNRGEDILRAVADAARVLTGANGIAIALRTGGVVLCRARSGDIAPELGSALNVGSGISGECFRTGEVLRCDDSETDARVDPEVCRMLGIRSLAVVPLRSPVEAVGILEAFASDAGAFSEEEVNSLKHLGEIVEAIYQREVSAAALTPLVPAAMPEGSGLPLVGAERRQQISLGALDEPLQKAKHHYWILTGAVALLLLASSVVWRTWREPAKDNAGSIATTQAHTLTGEAKTAVPPAISAAKPSASVMHVTPNSPRAKSVLKNAAGVEATEDAAAAHPLKKIAGNIILPLPASSRQTPPSGDSHSAAEPPTFVPGTVTTSEMLANIASAPTRLPEADLRVSQGVTGASLIHKVEPVYPKEAFAQRLSGTVTLEASITEDGTVHEVKVLQGETVLASAAVAAVRQWRYSPCLLNGKPVPVQKAITVVFKAP
jgi:TonB family protein